VRSSPGGATVTVDGVERGTTPLVLRDLPLGARHVVVARRGYVSAERRITLSGDRPSRSIEVALAPVTRAAPPARPAPPTTASLVIESRPAGASVSIDGRPVGVTPLTIASVAPGRHTVVITADGMRPVTSTVTVKAGERARVAASLERGQQEE
jgi:nucleoid-associated protein YgaU